VEFIIDLVLLMDVLVHSRTSYFEDKHHLQCDRAVIFQQYAHGWLAVDVITAIPFVTLIATPTADSRYGVQNLPRLLRLLKLIRMLHFFMVGAVAAGVCGCWGRPPCCRATPCPRAAAWRGSCGTHLGQKHRPLVNAI
jgi:hypothetical protein